MLWQRAPSAPGQGAPQFAAVHSARQRQVMGELLCQVCAGPADQNDDDGTLWLLQDRRTDWPGWPQGMDVTEPPICVHCLPIAIRACPALRESHAAIRAFTAPIVGIRGTLYTPSPTGPVAAGVSVVDFDNPDIRWVLAHQLIRTLHQAVVLN
ncbi:hypothetical protein [Actinokineospora spheciospongiae]|uniref:hypothetical protein n=1 Tax=Actinokineospora spheciospongiae TaxID=909613 RepID=UPI001267AAE4|nr:hypothetical protein [Actinokineospora spheciospongiae]